MLTIAKHVSPTCADFEKVGAGLAKTRPLRIWALGSGHNMSGGCRSLARNGTPSALSLVEAQLMDFDEVAGTPETRNTSTGPTFKGPSVGFLQAGA